MISPARAGASATERTCSCLKFVTSRHQPRPLLGAGPVFTLRHRCAQGAIGVWRRQNEVDMPRILPLLLVAASLTATHDAYGQNQRANQRETRRHTALQRVAVPRNTVTRPQRAHIAKARPQLSADDILAAQRKVGPYRDQQITLMEQLVRETPDSEALNKADLLFRLAEMYAKKARYLRYRAMELDGRIDRAASDARTDLQRMYRDYMARADANLERAAATYARVYRDDRYLAYARRDKVLFYGARAYAELDRPADARKAYHRLLRDHPKSPHVAEAYLAFADHYFESGALANAERFYRKILRLPGSPINRPIHRYARYKLAWVGYNLGRFQDALQGFYEVAQSARKGSKHRALYRAARADFVRTYAEIGRPDRAHQAFRKLDRGHALRMLQDLSARYLQHGKNRAAIDTLRTLLSLRPGHVRACSWRADIARATLAGNRSHADKASEMHALARRLVDARRRASASGPEFADGLSECTEAATELIGTMARTWHNEGMKTRDLATLQAADGLYERYLGTFADAPDRGETEYYRAELLWKLAELETRASRKKQAWERTARAFSAAVDGGRIPAGKVKDSAYAAVLAWHYAQPKGATRRASRPARTSAAPQPIPARDRQMLAAFDRYFKHVTDPTDADIPAIGFLKARTLVRYRHYTAAIPVLADIADRHLDHERAPAAVDMLLDALIEAGREDQLIGRVDELRSQSEFLASEPAIAARITRITRRHHRKRAEQLEKRARDRGDNQLFVECGKRYIDLYNSDTRAKDADELLYNAAVCFEDGKSLGTAIRLYRLASDKFPRSAHAPKALARLGSAFARAGYYRDAAATLERYGRRSTERDSAERALSEAVFYYRGTGASERALAATEQYVRKYGADDPQKAAEAMYNATAIHEASGDSDRVIAHLRKYLRRHAEAGGRVRRVAAHVRLGQLLWRKSCPISGGDGVDGACIRVKRAKNLGRGTAEQRRGVRARCGDDTRIQLQVVRRDRQTARAARRELQRALALADERHDLDAGSVTVPADVLRSVAAARFLLAEGAYENFLAVRFPGKLDFDPRKPRVMRKSQRRFAAWLDKKLAQAKRTRELYEKVRIGEAHYAIASAAREGQLWQNLADALFSAEVPRHLRRGRYAEDKVDAYCDALATRAEPLERASINAFGACLKTSTRLGRFSQFSRLCERELGQLRPDRFPVASEIRPIGGYRAAILSSERPRLP